MILRRFAFYTEHSSSVVETFQPVQNRSGGFGGGHGQLSHCATTYAVILSLAIVGGKDSLDIIDRRALWVVTGPVALCMADLKSLRWRWLGEVKQNDGGFRMCVGGEEDVRYDF